MGIYKMGGSTGCCENNYCNKNNSNCPSNKKCIKNCECQNDISSNHFCTENFTQNKGYDKFELKYFELENIYKLNNNLLDKWLNQQNDGPVNHFNEIVKMYGNPNILVNQPEGLCIWNINNSNDPHIRIELNDEYVPHCVP